MTALVPYDWEAHAQRLFKKKQVIRIGDRVRVLRSRFVKRVGYPLVWYEIQDEVEKDEKTWQAYCLLQGLSPKGKENAWPFEIKHLRDKMPRYLIQACAKLEVERRGFGGKERTIHYWPVERAHEPAAYGTRVPNYAGRVFSVIGKRVAKTGKRFPSSGGVHHDGEYWDEPGGLDDCKTHILLELSCGYEIERINVEKIDGREEA